MKAEEPRAPRRIIAFTGYPGVGKSYIAKKFAEQGDIPIVNMGDEMKHHYTTMPDGDHNAAYPDNTWGMAQSLRAEFGPSGAAYASISRIAAAFLEHNTVVVDGVRSPEEIKLFKAAFEVPITAIAIIADQETRLERFTERSGYYEVYEEMDDGKKVAEAIAEYEMLSRTDREIEAGLKDAVEDADHMFANNQHADLSSFDVRVTNLYEWVMDE